MAFWIKFSPFFIPPKVTFAFHGWRSPLSYELALHDTKVILNILFDCVFNCSPKSGVHRYFYNLIKHLPREFHKYSTTSITSTQIPNHFIPYCRHFRPHKLSFALEYFWFLRQCLAVNFDLVHSAFYNLSQPCRYLLAKGTPHIITVHDLIHELFDKEDTHIREDRKNILQHAKAIITESPLKIFVG